MCARKGGSTGKISDWNDTPLVNLRKGEERLTNSCDEKQRPRKVALSLIQVSASSILREKSYYAYANLK